MKRITIVGHLNTFTGYGNHACETVRGFQKLGYAVSFRAIEISKAFDSKIPLDVQSCLVQKPQPEDWEILISTNKTAPTPGKKTLFYTMHESTVIDPSRVAGINQAEHIVVPCEWNRHVFLENGVTRPISVIPMGFDPKVFHDAPIGDLKRIVFGAAGRTKHGRQRKGLDLIIKSFTEAFPTAKNVALKIKVFKDDEISDVNDPRIEVVRDYFTPRQIESWLHSISVFVNVGSEAFGFWPLQALACGRPVIAPKYGGLQVLNPPDMELPFEETDAGDFFKGKWCSVKKEDLIGEMRRLFAHPSLIREAARQCRGRVESLTWDNSVKALAELYEDLSSGKTVVTHKPVERRTCIVQLGRFGDILNILPVAKAMYDRDGVKPVMLVQRDYLKLLDGVTYVEPDVFDGDFSDVKGASKLAHQKYSEVIVAQVYGRDFTKTRDSYNVESWGASGYMSLWNKLPLILDARDTARESLLISKYIKKNPVLLFNGLGISSPFQDNRFLLEDIRCRWGMTFDIVDLSEIKADRIYDLLGLYDAAKGLVTIDTSTLHLASASKVPYCALISDRNSLWHGTRPRGNCKVAIRYSEALERREEIHQFIGSLIENPKCPRLVHVISEFFSNDDGNRRLRSAKETWGKVYYYNPIWRPLPILDVQLPRMFLDKDRKLPHFKDLIEFAAANSEESDILVFCNSDIAILESEIERFTSELLKHQIGFGNRREIKGPIDHQITKTQISEALTLAGGIDLFVFPVWWWKKIRHQFPDMVIGADSWDLVLHDLMLRDYPKAHGWHDVLYHEMHIGYWDDPKHKLQLPSRAHNLALSKRYFKEASSKFDHVFVINLEKRKDRMLEISGECGRVGILFERVNGIVCRKGIGTLNAPKLGCRMSHAACVRHSKERNYNAALILEDDAVFSDNFNEQWLVISKELNDLEWDVFLLGCQHFGPPKKLSTSIAQVTMFCLGHAYIVRSQAYDRVLRAYETGERPNDLALSDESIAGRLKILTAYPTVVFQRDSFSDNDSQFRRWSTYEGSSIDASWMKADGTIRVERRSCWHR